MKKLLILTMLMNNLVNTPFSKQSVKSTGEDLRWSTQEINDFFLENENRETLKKFVDKLIKFKSRNNQANSGVKLTTTEVHNLTNLIDNILNQDFVVNKQTLHDLFYDENTGAKTAPRLLSFLEKFNIWKKTDEYNNQYAPTQLSNQQLLNGGDFIAPFESWLDFELPAVKNTWQVLGHLSGVTTLNNSFVSKQNAWYSLSPDENYNEYWNSSVKDATYNFWRKTFIGQHLLSPIYQNSPYYSSSIQDFLSVNTTNIFEKIKNENPTLFLETKSEVFNQEQLLFDDILKWTYSLDATNAAAINQWAQNFDNNYKISSFLESTNTLNNNSIFLGNLDYLREVLPIWKKTKTGDNSYFNTILNDNSFKNSGFFQTPWDLYKNTSDFEVNFKSLYKQDNSSFEQDKLNYFSDNKPAIIQNFIEDPASDEYYTFWVGIALPTNTNSWQTLYKGDTTEHSRFQSEWVESLDDSQITAFANEYIINSASDGEYQTWIDNIANLEEFEEAWYATSDFETQSNIWSTTPEIKNKEENLEGFINVNYYLEEDGTTINIPADSIYREWIETPEAIVALRNGIEPAGENWPDSKINTQALKTWTPALSHFTDKRAVFLSALQESISESNLNNPFPMLSEAYANYLSEQYKAQKNNNPNPSSHNSDLRLWLSDKKSVDFSQINIFRNYLITISASFAHYKQSQYDLSQEFAADYTTWLSNQKTTALKSDYESSLNRMIVEPGSGGIINNYYETYYNYDKYKESMFRWLDTNYFNLDYAAASGEQQNYYALIKNKIKDVLSGDLAGNNGNNDFKIAFDNSAFKPEYNIEEPNFRSWLSTAIHQPLLNPDLARGELFTLNKNIILNQETSGFASMKLANLYIAFALDAYIDNVDPSVKQRDFNTLFNFHDESDIVKQAKLMRKIYELISFEDDTHILTPTDDKPIVWGADSSGDQGKILQWMRVYTDLFYEGFQSIEDKSSLDSSDLSAIFEHVEDNTRNIPIGVNDFTFANDAVNNTPEDFSSIGNQNLVEEKMKGIISRIEIANNQNWTLNEQNIFNFVQNNVYFGATPAYIEDLDEFSDLTASDVSNEQDKTLIKEQYKEVIFGQDSDADNIAVRNAYETYFINKYLESPQSKEDLILWLKEGFNTAQDNAITQEIFTNGFIATLTDPTAVNHIIISEEYEEWLMEQYKEILKTI